jgi:hypothetical protein
VVVLHACSRAAPAHALHQSYAKDARRWLYARFVAQCPSMHDHCHFFASLDHMPRLSWLHLSASLLLPCDANTMHALAHRYNIQHSHQGFRFGITASLGDRGVAVNEVTTPRQ